MTVGLVHFGLYTKGFRDFAAAPRGPTT
jgi:hypothetical protein